MAGIGEDGEVDESQGPDGARERPTRAAILEAALRILGREGYQGLTARRIAAEAGTNLALVNYYFGSKQNFLLALFDEFDRGKLGRQHEMYSDPNVPLSQKWRAAVEFYRQDLADGYVRMLQESVALGYGNPAIAERVRNRIADWRSLLEAVAAAYLPELGMTLPPAQVATAVASFWLGMETLHLSGVNEEEWEFFAILDSVGDWLAVREDHIASIDAPVDMAATSDVERTN